MPSFILGILIGICFKGTVTVLAKDYLDRSNNAHSTRTGKARYGSWGTKGFAQNIETAAPLVAECKKALF